MSRVSPVIACFDVDGTLTVPRKPADPEMLEFLRALREDHGVTVAIVGGSDLVKIREQLGSDIEQHVDYCFAENGLVAYEAGRLIGTQSLIAYLGETRLQALLNYCLRYVADLDIPVKRGTFIEFRNGMLNVSPIGRNCSQAERDAFEVYDAEHGIRRDFITALKAQFPDYDLTYSIGGQISFDVFPRGWDKTYCLRYPGRPRV